jgi:hypothetical protein
VALARDSEQFSFPLSGSLHHCSILIFIHMLLLPKEQTGEDWEGSKSDDLFEWQN